MGLFDDLKKKVIDTTGLDPFPDKEDLKDLKDVLTDVTGLDPFPEGKKSPLDFRGELKNPLKDVDSFSEDFDKVFDGLMEVAVPGADRIQEATYPEAASRIKWEKENSGPDKIFEKSGAGARSLVIRLSERSVTLCPSADDEIHLYYQNKAGQKLEVREEGNVTYITDPDKNVLKAMQQMAAPFGGRQFKAEIPSGKGYSVDITIRGLPEPDSAVTVTDLDLHSLRVNEEMQKIILERVRVEGGIGLHTQSAPITLKEVTAGGAAMITTNEPVLVQNSQLGKLSAATCNAKVKVIDSRADQIFLNPDNSGIEVKNLESGDITFLTDMGTISGTIKGKQEDWAITSRAEGLFNSLPEFQSGEKPLLAVASEGSIRLSFLG